MLRRGGPPPGNYAVRPAAGRAPPAKRRGAPNATHAVYLAVIAVLVVVIVCAGARATRASRMAREAEERYGLRAEVRSSAPRPEPLRKISAEDLLRGRTYAEYRKELDGLVARALELGEFGGGEASGACARALRGGERLRPIIIMEVARAATLARRAAAQGADPPVDVVDPADAALSIEYLHAAATLAADGRPPRAGEEGAEASPAAAQPAVLFSLVSAAFQDVSRQVDWIRDNCPEFKGPDRVGTRLCHDVGQAIGPAGGPARPKTAAFFEICFLAGWLVSGGSAEGAAEVKRAGRHFGAAFQIADDMSRGAAGKPGRSFATEYGGEEAARAVTQNLNACRLLLEEKGLYTPLWREIYERVWIMT